MNKTILITGGTGVREPAESRREQVALERAEAAHAELAARGLTV
jgi:hypothetical protein